VKKALVFGASGGLAKAIIYQLLDCGWQVDAVCRNSRASTVISEFANFINEDRVRLHLVGNSYSDYIFTGPSDLLVFTQCLFDPKPLVEMSSSQISEEVIVGLVDLIQLTYKFLRSFPSIPESRRDFCFIGSTSAYSGYKNTSVYCAVKHGLLGFVRALNDEYSSTTDRFWLFSMGTMLTEMGAKVQGQDCSTYLDPKDVAVRIVESVASPSNLFEPEVIIRRRSVRFLLS